jgi:hypothetical protein
VKQTAVEWRDLDRLHRDGCQSGYGLDSRGSIPRQRHHFHTSTVSNDGKEGIKGQTEGSVMNALIFRMCGVLPPCYYAYLYIGIGTGTGEVLHGTLSVTL